MFKTNPEDLVDILKNVNTGVIQLPDFQRDYVWADEDVKSLISSITKGFPVGALLTLEIGGEVSFKPRFLEGVPITEKQPDILLLDGQQRITSLYQSMLAKAPVKTRNVRGNLIERLYYLDIQIAVSGVADLDEAIVGVPADKVLRENFGKDVKLDLSNPEQEYENHMFPLNLVFDNRDWVYGWRDYWRAKEGAESESVLDMERKFVDQIIKTIERYKMPLIQLDQTNSREAICLVFEKVNVGGKKLDAFELVTAIFAAGNFDLRADWNGETNPPKIGRRARMVGYPNPRNVLTKVANTDFLQACALLYTREIRLARAAAGATGKELPQVNCKRDALLALPLEAYQKYATSLEEGFIEASKLLNELKIIWHKDIPYPPLLIALASVFAILGRTASTAAAKQKLTQWFWAVTLGELYGSSTESRLARDVPELIDWISIQGSHPRSLDEAIFQQERLRSLRTRVSGAYKGMHALLMHHGCLDFITGRGADLMTFFNDKIDIHHIFPRAWCKKQTPAIPPAVYNSIVNKTPLSKLSNIQVGGRAPSDYLKRIEKETGLSPEALDDILRTHLIEPEHLRNDDFGAFFQARLNALSGLIANAMGKPVVMEQGSNEIEIEDDLLESPDSEIEVSEQIVHENE